MHSETGGALADGTLSAAKAEILARFATQRRKTYERDEKVLLASARKLRPDGFLLVGLKWREYADDEEATDEKSKRFEERFVRLTDTLDAPNSTGSSTLEAAALVRSALDAIDRPDPTNGVVKPRSSGQRYADALVDLARESLARTKRGGRFVPNIDAVLDVNRGRRPPRPIRRPAHTRRWRRNGRRAISPEMIERLLCDCNLGRVLMRGDSEVLDVGRRTRSVNRAQWRALIRPDKHCRFPDCATPPEWTDVHHTTRWIDGGETNLDDLVLLCRYHRTSCATKAARALTRHPDGTITTTKPETDPSPDPTPHHPPEPAPLHARRVIVTR